MHWGVEFHVGSMEGIDDNSNGWADCCNDGGRERGSMEESAQCRVSLSGMNFRDARPGLVLGSGGRPGLEGEPRVQKWLICPVLTQRGLSLDPGSAAARSALGTSDYKREVDTHIDSEHTHAWKGKRALRNISLLHLEKSVRHYNWKIISPSVFCSHAEVI